MLVNVDPGVANLQVMREHFWLTFTEIRFCCRLPRFCSSYYFTFTNFFSAFGYWQASKRGLQQKLPDNVITSSHTTAIDSSDLRIEGRRQLHCDVFAILFSKKSGRGVLRMLVTARIVRECWYNVFVSGDFQTHQGTWMHFILNLLLDCLH